MIDRDTKGRFTKGGIPGPGRPKRSVEVEFHNILLDAVSAADWKKIVTKAVADALAGDRFARQFIAEYTIGKPPTILELRAGDAVLLAELLKQFEAAGTTPSEVFNAMLSAMAEEETEVEQNER